MNFRQLFSNQTWWGKLIGAFFGYLVAGPAGALLGILIGNFFDRGLAQHYTRPFWYYHVEKNTSVKALFFTAMFKTLGHIAKANGRVSEDAIRMAKDIMEAMQLSLSQRKSAQVFFNEGKNPQFNLEKLLTSLYEVIQNNPNLINYFIETSYTAIQLGGVSTKKLAIMNTILSYMHLAPLNQQNRFTDDFGFNQNSYQNYSNYRSNSSAYQTQQNPLLNEAYAILGVKPSANQQEVKRAYRKKMSQNHPDKLIARGLPEHMIKAANEKTQQIRRAYEEILKNRGW